MTSPIRKPGGTVPAGEVPAGRVPDAIVRREGATASNMQRSSRWPWAFTLGCAGTAATVLAAVLVAAGGAPHPAPAELPDAGTLTGWALPATQLLNRVAVVLTAGLLLSAAVLLPAESGKRGERSRLSAHGRSLVVSASLAAAVAAIAALALIPFTLSSVLGAPPSQALDAALLWTFITDIAIGRALAVQAALALLVVVVALATRAPRGASLALLLTLTAAAMPALGGHATAEDNHVLAVVSLVLHLLGATLWFGGLAGLARVALANSAALTNAVPRYSHLALWCAAVVLASGVLNGSLRVGGFEDLLSGYGLLLLAKVAAFGALASLGWLHRRRILRRFSALAAGGRPGVHGNGAQGAGGQDSAARRAFARLAAVELLVMAGTFGLAVGLSRTPPPAPAPQIDHASTSAEALLGYPLAEAPTIANLFGTVHLDAFGLTFAALAAALYLTGARVLHRRGDVWPKMRTAIFLSGAAVVLIVTCTGVGQYAQALFSVHMVQHMTLNMIAPLMLVLGAPITLALRALPVRDRRTLLSALNSHPARFFAHPLVATGIFIVSLYALYFTPLFEAAMRNHWGHLAMQAHFLVSGFLFFWLIIGVDPDPRRPGRLLRVPLILAVMLTHTIFSVVLVFGATVIGETYYAELAHPWAGPLLDDQALGGAFAWAIGELVAVGVLAALILQWFGAAERADHAQKRVRTRAGSVRPSSPAAKPADG